MLFLMSRGIKDGDKSLSCDDKFPAGKFRSRASNRVINIKKNPSSESSQFLSLETMAITVGVLALQGAFFEHVQLLKKAAEQAPSSEWQFIEVRTPQELATCDGLVLPGGESTTMSLVAARSNLLEPLREFVK